MIKVVLKYKILNKDERGLFSDGHQSVYSKNRIEDNFIEEIITLFLKNGVFSFDLKEALIFKYEKFESETLQNIKNKFLYEKEFVLELNFNSLSGEKQDSFLKRINLIVLQNINKIAKQPISVEMSLNDK